MLKKSVVVLAVLSLICSLLASCKREPTPSSSLPTTDNNVSSQITSSEPSTSGSLIDIEPEKEYTLVRNSFLSQSKNGDLFYCGATGGIYKQLADNKGISKIYSGVGYEFFSVDCIEEDKICVGFKSDKFESNYIIFNLKDKTVEPAVAVEEFKNTSIYSLLHYEGATYFLANPDRYNRYTLYKQTAEGTKALVKGVNEYFIWGENIFYNIGNEIYSLYLKSEPAINELMCKTEYSYLYGFTITGTMLLYSTENDTYFTNFISGGYSTLPTRLNVWAGAKTSEWAFFCGTKGGIYALSLETGILTKASDYTAENLECIGGYLYLSPTKEADYPEVDKSLIIRDGIYRFAIGDLLSQIEPEKDESADVSSSLSQSEVISSSPAVEESEPIKPEKFGR
ncbi:MAG: hypothetical protein IJY33_02720 [Oscillospiraceae bacterium]|nr:hypothetical protein [Oscillospiraceae bacterium]